MSFRLSLAVAAALGAAVIAAPARAASFYATTGTGSDEIVIDAANPHSWVFTASTTYSIFLGGVFAMKPAPATTLDIQLVLEDPSTLNVLGTVTLASTSFASSTEYARAIFGLSPVVFSDGDQFRITLSVTGDLQTGTGGYSVRGTAEPIGLDLTEDPSAIALAIDAPATTTPEPAAAGLLAAALLGLAATRRMQPHRACLTVPS